MQYFILKEQSVTKKNIGQDFCYAVSDGKLKVAKPLLHVHGIMVRHIIGSVETVSILNHFGHCASQSVLLELETAMCNDVIESQTNLSATISINTIRYWYNTFHSWYFNPRSI